MDHNLWYIRDKPKDGELLSSWIVRLAFAQKIKLETFCYQACGRGAQIMVRDIDLHPTSSILQTLTSLSGATEQQVRATTLQSYQGTLFAHPSKNHLAPWITYLGKTNKTRFIPKLGLSYCPQCLVEDVVPYGRKSWRMAFSIFCLKHRIKLEQNCIHCGSPFSIKRWDKGTHSFYDGNPITHCPECRKHRGSSKAQVSERVNNLITFQEQLEHAAEHGWTIVNGRPVDAMLFFPALACLATIVLDRQNTWKIRNLLNQKGFLPTLLEKDTSSCRIESLDLALRYEVMEVLAWFLADWPLHLIATCRECNFSSTYIFDNAKQKVSLIPFWFWEPIYLMLNGNYYSPSDEEIDAIVIYLQKRQLTVRKIDIVKLLGVSWLNKATLQRLASLF